MAQAIDISGLTNALANLQQSNALVAQRKMDEDQRRRQGQANTLQTIGTVAGAVIGAPSGPAGMQLGAGIGSAVGSTAGNTLYGSEGNSQTARNIQTGLSAYHEYQQQDKVNAREDEKLAIQKAEKTAKKTAKTATQTRVLSELGIGPEGTEVDLSAVRNVEPPTFDDTTAPTNYPGDLPQLLAASDNTGAGDVTITRSNFLNQRSSAPGNATPNAPSSESASASANGGTDTVQNAMAMVKTTPLKEFLSESASASAIGANGDTAKLAKVIANAKGNRTAAVYHMRLNNTKDIPDSIRFAESPKEAKAAAQQVFMDNLSNDILTTPDINISDIKTALRKAQAQNIDSTLTKRYTSEWRQLIVDKEAKSAAAETRMTNTNLSNERLEQARLLNAERRQAKKEEVQALDGAFSLETDIRGLTELEKRFPGEMNESGVTATISRKAQNFVAGVGSNLGVDSSQAIDLYNKQATGLSGRISKSIQRETGVLSNQDNERAVALIPNAGDDPKLRKLKLEYLDKQAKLVTKVNISRVFAQGKELDPQRIAEAERMGIDVDSLRTQVNKLKQQSSPVEVHQHLTESLQTESSKLLEEGVKALHSASTPSPASESMQRKYNLVK